MARRSYNTVPIDLIECADAIGDHFSAHGHTLKVEKLRLGYPNAPTFECKRGATMTFIEIHRDLQKQRIVDWVNYAHSCSRDTRVAIGLPESSAGRMAKHVPFLQSNGVGLYVAFAAGVIEQLAPRDLALHVTLPDPKSLPTRVRKLLGGSYDQFSRSQWREGFEDACVVLETEARRYLKKWIKTTRITILDAHGRPDNPSYREIERMTMGALASVFSRVQAPNHADVIIAQTLQIINKDRVGVAHHKSKAVTEKRLRMNVGQHMYTIIAALKHFV